jgi:hypothetical protein
MGREELLGKLTGMAADVVRDCRVELALGWLWCNKSKEPLPGVPPDLFKTLKFVRDQGGQEVDAAYTGGDYFEDCLRLALRKSQSVAIRKTRPRTGGDHRARARWSEATALGTSAGAAQVVHEAVNVRS